MTAISWDGSPEVSAAFLRRYRDRIVVTVGGCWLWTGRTDKDGYGLLNLGAKTTRAAREGFAYSGQEVPSHLALRPTCHESGCVNPHHHELVSWAELAPRGGYREVCPAGHSYSGDNLYVSPQGRRSCHQCRVEATRRYRKRQKEHAQ